MTGLASGADVNAATQPAWNPFDDDNFAQLPAEEFKAEDKQPGEGCVCASPSSRVQTSEHNLWMFLPDRPSELQQTPCEELIPGLQTSSVDSTPQEDGKALSPQPKCFFLFTSPQIFWNK